MYPLDVTNREKLFLPDRALKKLVKEQPTPFYLYDEASIKDTVRKLMDAFAWKTGFGLYFPVRMNANATILRILLQSGCGVSCCTGMELMLCERVGFTGTKILYAPMVMDPDADRLCRKLGAVRVIENEAVLPQEIPAHVLLRLNPDSDSSGSDRAEKRRFGMSGQTILSVVSRLLAYGSCSIGLCAEGAAMEKRPDYYPMVARKLFSLADTIRKEQNVLVDWIHLGAGLPFTYRPGSQNPDVMAISSEISTLSEQFLLPAGLGNVRLSMEPGRYLLAGAGIFVMHVCSVTQSTVPLILTDGSMAQLARPSQIGNYHYVSVLGKHEVRGRIVCNVAGALADRRDLFARRCVLSPVRPGDCIIVHDVGADGAALQNGYGGVLGCAQYLHAANGTLRQIACAQRPEQWLSACGLPD